MSPSCLWYNLLMNTPRSAGFSIVKFTIILFATLIVLGGLVYGVSEIVKQSQINSASTFIADFVNKIQNSKPDTTYNLLASNLQEVNHDGSYYTWYLWASPFANSSVKIDTSSQIATYSNSSFLGLSPDGSSIKFVYKTSANSSVFFLVSYSNKKWAVSDYGTL